MILVDIGHIDILAAGYVLGDTDHLGGTGFTGHLIAHVGIGSRDRLIGSAIIPERIVVSPMHNVGHGLLWKLWNESPGAS